MSTYEVISVIAQVIIAIATLATFVVLFLSARYAKKQIDHGRKQIDFSQDALRIRVRDSCFESIEHWNYAVMNDYRFPIILQHGCKDFNKLEHDDEKAIFINIMYGFFKTFENIFLHSLQDTNKEYSLGAKEAWDFNKKLFLAYATKPGAKFYWENRRKIFDDQFVAYVDRKMEDTQPGYTVITQWSTMRKGK